MIGRNDSHKAVQIFNLPFRTLISRGEMLRPPRDPG
jgi:hypothetical protein